ncbi:probable hydrocarbon oxygenase MocD [hydrothermal vent metagenome]|uniref:Probable hydrocarbon oxygenase MocD n=1 Tax=hydrothermal vent metagenome TaxID=652676 RepID=A0A3B0TKA1_9ZZZZ
MARPAPARDYSLIGKDAEAAVANGLADARWYKTEIPRKQLKALMTRRDGPAIRDTVIWLGLMVGFAAMAVSLWGSWWSVPFFAAYGVLYGSATDSRWHECSHGTAFRTRWMNDAVYHLASFMIMREPTYWRWSHARHHSDTIIVGRDPEIAAMRPPNLLLIGLKFLGIRGVLITARNVFRHALGQISEEEKSFIPQSEWPKLVREARIWLVIHALPIAAGLIYGSWLPVLLVGPLPTLYGAWLHVYFGITQHVGLAENVLDHRLNSRTIYMNPVFRFIYWNMNYHVEHHMFPMVPYHRLPELHEIVKPDTPPAYRSTIEAYAEIIPALARQVREPDWCIERTLPATARAFQPGAGTNSEE